jgi:hypothetical protein
MHTATAYRLTVLGSIVSSFMAGLHVPVLHEIIEHGAAPRWDVLTATLLLVVGAVAGTWKLLRR